MPSSSASTSRVQQQQHQQEEEEPHVVMRQRRGRPSCNNNKTTITTTTTKSIELVDVTPPAVVACFGGDADADAASMEGDAGDEGDYNHHHAAAAGRSTTRVQSSCNDKSNSTTTGELLLTTNTRITTRDWTTPYVPPPMVQQSTIMVLGCFIFGLAMIWPPLILLLTYLAAKLIPYSFRENDDPAVRRELFHQFSQEADHLPDRFKNIHRYVDCEESYWKNERYVCCYELCRRLVS
jgi:hypothetical protein